ncbi:TIGR01777 family oxidoreductase [Skermania piniformis]|uniref:TIGR01777 family oxidoreductase n=1 Tax=Skermania pinensis TaxID=39122 RepID=A0ABX8SD58_9ACTN|nr:TIGR01777 family oxidoreductase [Skermania piniformis]QXQ15356.1 TIGR01777 family oxidoreductase [Skermania piniformis]
MSITYRSDLPFPRTEVFDWHARPGAILRLIPPWQPMRVREESGSLRDGRAVLTLPLGLRWTAAHDPAEFDPPHRFVDEVDGIWPVLPSSAPLPWRHTHTFEELPDGGTRVIDRVDAPLPAAALRPTFVYRHRQLTDDLAAHATATAAGFTNRTIAVTGSSGLVGSALTALLTTGGHRVIRLVRGQAQDPDERRWDTEDPAPDLLDGVDAVVHLAGESISGRFTEAHKQAIRDSRIAPTQRLAEVAAATVNGPTVFVSASAIGYYGADRGAETLTEQSSRGNDFLADVVADWEAATQPAADAGIRCVQVRTGIVQSPRGGTLQLLRPLFAAGLGGRLGSGKQWLSWIGIDDLIEIYLRALYDGELTGPVNAVAPEPVRNSEYTAALAGTLHRPAILPVPSFGPRLLLGDQGATELAYADQRVLPAALDAVGHRFRFTQIRPALAHLLGRTG